MQLSQRARKTLWRFLPVEFIWYFQDILRPKTFGQLGEDAVIYNHLSWLGLPVGRRGAYLDIGGHHPTRGSNTAKFYRRGSRGFVVDFGRRKALLWKVARRRDIFINAACVPNSLASDDVAVTMSNHFGGARDALVNLGENNPQHRHLVKAITAEKLAQFVITHELWQKAPWKFISIDVEGIDEDILRDLNLHRLKADVIAIEHFLPSRISPWMKIPHLLSEPLVAYLAANGYSLQSICGPTLVFVRIASFVRL